MEEKKGCENPDVTLVELNIDKKANEIDIGEFTQELRAGPFKQEHSYI